MSAFVLYLLIMLESIACLFVVFGVISVGVVAITAFGVVIDSEDTASIKPHASWMKRWLVYGAIAFTIATFIPTNKQLAMIMGGYVVTNAESVGQIPDNTMKAINKFLEDYVEDTKEKK